MNTNLTKDARALSDGVMKYLRRDGKNTSSVPKVQRLLTRVTAQARKEKVAFVETGIALNNIEKKSLETMLAKMLDHEISVENTVNPEVVGGMKIQVGDWVVDTTLASQLQELAVNLTAE
jgi:F0F1-type ATP synthase delta subunit